MTKISIESSNVLLDVQVESASEALQQLSQTLFKMVMSKQVMSQP